MTSSSSPGPGAQPSRPLGEIELSQQTSPRFSITENPDRFRSLVEATDRSLVQQSLSSLGAINPTRPINTYADIRAFEIDTRSRWLVRIRNLDWFIPASTTKAQVIDAAKMLHRQATPSQSLRSALVQLWLVTRHQKVSDDDRDATLQLYADRLASYPADHVALALYQLSETATFFPSWSEIAQLLKECDVDRSTLLAAYRLVLPKLETP